jgi:hypothetical protein
VQPQICQEPGQSGTSIAGLEELTIGRTQAEEGELQEQRRQEVVDSMMEIQDDDGYLRGEQEDKQHQDTVEDPGSEIHLSTGSDRSYNANDQGRYRG